jgi:tetratricopeptide (TPR) repeat protein
LVSVFEAAGNSTKTAETLQRAVALDPPLPEPYAKLGLLLLQNSRQDESTLERRVEELFKKAEELGTEEPAVYLWLAEQQRSIPLTHLAVGNAVRKAGRIRLQAAQSLGGREDEELDAETVSTLKGMSDRLEQPLAILTESIELLRTLHNGTEDFEEDLAMLLDWYPHSVELKEAAGSFYESEARWEDARRMWANVLEMDPMSYPAQYGMAKALENVDEFDQAALFYRRALGIDSSDTSLYDGLFRVYTAMGKREELLSILERHAILDSRNPLLFEHLSNLEARMGLQERDEKHRKRAEYLHNLFAESTADDRN